MLSPSVLGARIIAVWIPAYLLLLIHAALISNAREFIEIFVFYPMLCGVPLAVYSFYQQDENEELLESIGMPESMQLYAVLLIYILLPLGFVMFAMLQAQQVGSYSGVAWIVIIFGGLILGELGKQLKFKA